MNKQQSNVLIMAVIVLAAAAVAVGVWWLASDPPAQPSAARLEFIVEGDRLVLPSGSLADVRTGEAGGRPVLQVRLSPDSAKWFGNFTKKHVGKKVRIVLEGETIAAPVIREPILGGRLTIHTGSRERLKAIERKLRR